MNKTAVLTAAFVAGSLGFSLSAAAQGSSRDAFQAPPFVSLSLIGSDVVFSPDRIRYSVSADPGTYVSVFLISPSGRRSVLNPSETEIKGSKRAVFIREAVTRLESGESYLVAVATRSSVHSSNLVRQVRGGGRLAGSNTGGADASLNELLSAILPSAGDDFSATYALFRVISRGLPQRYAYAPGCSSAEFIGGDSFLDDGFYIGRSLDAAAYKVIADEDPLFYEMRQPYLLACRNRLFDRAMIVARALTPPLPPIAHTDTGAVGVDSARPPVNSGPRTHPVDPGTPFGYPAMPAPLGVTPSTDLGDPATSSLRVDTRPSIPVTANTPVTVERREPIAPVVAPPTRVHPVDRAESQPVREPTIRAEPRPVSSPPIEPRMQPPPPPPRVAPTPQPAPVTPAPAPPPAV